MAQVSRTVSSSQRGVHPRLCTLVTRHRENEWRKPPQRVDMPALAALDLAVSAHSGPLILDSFCGTGHSSAILAGENPEALVIGVDKSADRLRRSPAAPDNCLLLRAHCEAVWRHLATRGLTLQAHYVLYPNPWPKPGQLTRRVHGHPALPTFLSLGGRVELRSNWQVYVEEFGVALHLFGIATRIAVLPATAAPLTRFEQKYRDSGQDLWRVTADLNGDSGAGAPTTP